MPRASLTVTYSDLIRFTERSLLFAQRRHDEARAKGVTNLQALSQDVEIARTLVKMLKKGQPVKQTDLFALFNAIQ